MTDIVEELRTDQTFGYVPAKVRKRIAKAADIIEAQRKALREIKVWIEQDCGAELPFSIDTLLTDKTT